MRKVLVLNKTLLKGQEGTKEDITRSLSFRSSNMNKDCEIHCYAKRRCDILYENYLTIN